MNAFVYDNINNGVYRCGLAKSQAAYAAAFHKLFAALDELERTGLATGLVTLCVGAGMGTATIIERV